MKEVTEDYRETLTAQGYKLVQTAAHKRYVSRKIVGIMSGYRGTYGEGYTVDRPRWDTTNYCYREYWIQEA